MAEYWVLRPHEIVNKRVAIRGLLLDEQARRDPRRDGEWTSAARPRRNGESTSATHPRRDAKLRPFDA